MILSHVYRTILYSIYIYYYLIFATKLVTLICYAIAFACSLITSVAVSAFAYSLQITNTSLSLRLSHCELFNDLRFIHLFHFYQ
jgi:hypothetical protein